LSRKGCGGAPWVIVRGFRLKGRGFRLVPRPRPRRAQPPSRSLPRCVRAGRSRLRAALLAAAWSLPPGAFGLVPPLHDDRPQISVPMTTTPVAFLTSETPAGRSPFRSPASGCRARAGQHLTCRQGVRCSPDPTRGTGSSSRTWKTPPVVSILDPTHHRTTKALASVASAK
jgi:hypothetical protein